MNNGKQSLLDRGSARTGRAVRNPVYLEVRETIRKELTGGTWTIGNRIQPEIELSREFGVNRHTVRKAVDALVEEGCLERIPGSGTYVRKIPLERHTETTRFVSTVSPFFAHPEDGRGSELMSGLLAGSEKTGLEMLIKSSNGEVGKELVILKTFLSRERMVAGGIFLLDGDKRNTMIIRALDKAGFPLVLVDRYTPDCDVSFVGMDEQRACGEIADYLRLKKHASCAVISCNRLVSSIRERTGLLRQAFRDLGLPAGDDRFLHCDGVYDEETLRDFENRICALTPRPTALIFLTRSLAVPLLERFKRHPDLGRAEIISYRALKVDPPFRQGPHIHVPMYEMGVEAFRVLKQMLKTQCKMNIRLRGKFVLSREQATAAG